MGSIADEIHRRQSDALFKVLEKWYLAIEDGTAVHWDPDPAFAALPGKSEITEELVEEFISELDREMDIDALSSRGEYFGADATPEFKRLVYPQRMALLQEVMGVVKTSDEIEAETEALENKLKDAPSGFVETEE